MREAEMFEAKFDEFDGQVELLREKYGLYCGL